MQKLTVLPDRQTLAEAVAKETVTILQAAIEKYGSAVWVLAGGTTPELAYQYITSHCLDMVDWSHVIFAIGDERITPDDPASSNWHMAEQALLQHTPDATFLRPISDQSADDAAADYNAQIDHLIKVINECPRLDLVWLGTGADGHTLSLFPDHPAFNPDDTAWVIPVHDSPKLPADRISLTLHTLRGAQHTIIIASGAEKAAVVAASRVVDTTLPIAQAARITHAQWFVDEAAAKS